MTYAEGLKDQGSYKPCNLVAGEYPRIERIVTIAAGANLSKGSVLGRITADGKFVLSATASSNGSEVPDAILAEVADATSTDVQAVVYFSGEFNENALVLGTGHTSESIRTPLRAKSIFLAKNQSA